MAANPVAAAPRRTYGRVQKKGDVSDTSSMLGASLTRSDMLETVIPDSDGGQADDETPQATPAKSKDAFGLWARLQDLDREFDDDDEPSNSPVKKLSTFNSSLIAPSTISEAAESATLRSSLTSVDPASNANIHVPTNKRHSVPIFFSKADGNTPHRGDSSDEDEKGFSQSSPEGRQPSTPGTSPENLGKAGSWSDDENQPPLPAGEKDAQSPGGLRRRSSTGRAKSREPKIKVSLDKNGNIRWMLIILYSP